MLRKKRGKEGLDLQVVEDIPTGNDFEVIPEFTVSETENSIKVQNNSDVVRGILETRLKMLNSMGNLPVGTAQSLKKEITKVRRGITAKKSEFKRAIDQKIAPFNTAVQELLDLIAEYEARIDKVLQEQEALRREGVEELIKKTIDKLNADADSWILSEEWLNRIVLPKKVFNKTAKLDEIASWVEEAFNIVLGKFREYQAASSLIRKTCEGVIELDVKSYLEMLSYRTCPEILQMIEAQKERINSAKEEKEAAEAVIQDIPEKKDVSRETVPDEKAAKKTMIWKIQYEEESAAFLREVYKNVAETAGISVDVQVLN